MEKKYIDMKFMRINVLCMTILAFLAFESCSKVQEPVYLEKDYGHVQFKLYKAASYEDTRAVVSQLNYLKDVSKMKVTMSYEGKDVIQTLIMNSSNEDAAEFGLRSDKLKLLAGEYQVQTFTLFDKMDNPLYESTPTAEHSTFNVVAGGLCVHDLLANTVERGKVRFTLVKDMSSFTEMPESKAVSDEYTFDEIEYVSLTVRTGNTTLPPFEMLPAEFSVHFTDDGVEDGYQTSSCECDTLLTLIAGEYSIESYSVFDSGKKLLETNDKVKASFVVSDNKVTDADVPVTLHESDDYIKDYYALYEIWKSLNGPDWYYVGESYHRGANWDFNKDPDLWGDQPGVSLHSNGRVALISLSDFGFHGHMSPAIGQLTELVELYLGSHNDLNLIGYDPIAEVGKGTSRRMERHKAFLKHLYPATQMAEPVARAFAEHDIVIPETDLYETMTESQLIDKATGAMRIGLKDGIAGKVNNGLKSLPEQIGNLTKLEQFFIANSEIETLPESLSNLISCTDVEIYNCPNMKSFPMSVAQMPELITLNIANNLQWSSEEVLKGLKALANGPSAEKLQLLYLNKNNLEVIPKEIKKMKKLGLLDFSSNKIHTIEEAWGNDIKPVQVYLDNNRLSAFPVDEKGVFCYMEDTETFSVKNNDFTQFPNIFDAGAMFAIVSIDFSYNHISSFPSDFKGVYVQTLTIANNPEFTKYPIEIAKSNSKIMNINFRGCNIDEVPSGAFEYENSIYLQSLDLSYNDLDDLPWDMHAGNMPYLYGVELSYNKFSSFPWEPLDSQYLTVFAIRGQRNDNGERCLSEWPTGLYNHRGLRGFYIGSNNLGKIEDTISTLIYYLDISDNPEIVFDASDICYAHQVGAYYLIYDKTQDIRNCDYMLN
jgi:Leucine-rich repeat (LRR) protein